MRTGMRGALGPALLLAIACGSSAQKAPLPSVDDFIANIKENPSCAFVAKLVPRFHPSDGCFARTAAPCIAALAQLRGSAPRPPQPLPRLL
jgi:hypothetical protein